MVLKYVRRWLQACSIVLLFCLTTPAAEPDATASAQPETAAAAPSAYRLQAGDEVEIRVMNLPELSATVRVRPDGMFSVMLLDDIRAEGRTIAEVRQFLADGYAKFYRTPRVSVVANTFSNRTIYITGEVLKPGSVPLAANMTALQAVIQAGGLLPSAKTSEAVLLRASSGGGRQVVALRLDAVLKGTATDMVLEPTDMVYVPKSDIKVYVGGEVKQPGLIPMDGSLSALAAVMSAGGMLDTASPNNAVLIRDRGDRTPVVMPLRLNEVMKGTFTDTELRPYDIIFIPRSNIAKINKAVDQFIRRVIPFTLTGGFSYILGGSATSPVNFFP